MNPGGADHRATGPILIAEDDEDLRMTMADALRLNGHEVAQAAAGDEALERLRRDRFGVVVLDMLLPGASGVEILKELLSWPAADRPRVVAISGGGPAMSGAYALALARIYASDKVLYKPFTPDELIAAVRGVS